MGKENNPQSPVSELSFEELLEIVPIKLAYHKAELDKWEKLNAFLNQLTGKSEPQRKAIDIFNECLAEAGRDLTEEELLELASAKGATDISVTKKRLTVFLNRKLLKKVVKNNVEYIVSKDTDTEDKEPELDTV